MATTEKFVGQPVLRKEDPEFLTGAAKYTDDLTAPGMLWMAVVRSPYAHARIKGVDLSAALSMEGVVAAYSAQDFEWAGPLLMAWPVTEDINSPPHFPLAAEKARYQGDGVAVVVAGSRGLAEDAAEAVAVEYEALDTTVDVEAALADGAPLVHEEFGTNRCYTWTNSNGDVDEVFARAPVVVKERYRVQRQVANAMEPRAILVQPNTAAGQYTMWTSTQIPHVLRTAMTLATGIPESKLRIIAPRVGGGFGSKLQVYPEEALALAIAGKLGRPIKWTETRTEGYLATHHGRDQVQEIELAANKDGKILGYRARVLANMGAYLGIIAPGTPILGAFLYCGCYGGEAYEIEMIGGLTIDSGNYPATLDQALGLIDYEQLRKEQKARRDSGEAKQIGIGFSTYLENCGWGPSRIIGGVLKYAGGGWEAATIRCHPTGKVVAVVGTTPHGQGNETTFAQVVADELGVPVDDVEVLFGDTDVAPSGWDTYGSRSAAVGTPAVHRAAKKVLDKARKIAAHELEVAEDDLQYEAGSFSVKGAPENARTIPQIAFSAWTGHNLPDGLEPGLEESAFFDPGNLVFPFGAHICVVEVDTETGATEVLKYVAVDDVGPIINPQIVEGQVVGGVIQGISEALFEEAIYDDNGQLLSSSMANYAVPAASEMPAIVTGNHVTPSTTNELGIKGVGETGTIASPPAVLNAVVDALSPLGVTAIERPASPENVWRAIRQAKGGAA